MTVVLVAWGQAEGGHGAVGQAWNGNGDFIFIMKISLPQEMQETLPNTEDVFIIISFSTTMTE